MHGGVGYRDVQKSRERGGGEGDYVPSGFRKGQLQQFTPEQMEILKQMGVDVGPDSYLSKLAGGDQSLFEEMEAPALRQFSGLQGQLANRFSSGGGTSGTRSNTFQNAQTSAASNFAQELQAQRQGLQRQSIQDLQGMRESFLNQRPYDQFLLQKEQKKPNAWGQIGSGLAAAAPGAIKGFAKGGIPGALVGGLGGYASYAAQQGDS